MNRRKIVILLTLLFLLGMFTSMAVNAFRNVHRSQTEEQVTICLWPKEPEKEDEDGSICIYTAEPELSEE